MRKIFLLVLLNFFIVGTQTESVANIQKKSELEAREKLKHFAAAYISQANTALRCNRNAKVINKVGNEFVAIFHEVDMNSLSIEVHPSSSRNIQYIGHVIYIEKCYECRGKTQIEAKQGMFKATSGRRVRELARYINGEWEI